MEEVEATKNIMDRIEDLQKLHRELMEESKEQTRAILKEFKEDLVELASEVVKKVLNEKNEEMKNVMEEKDEMLKIIIKENDKKLEEKRCELDELEDTNSTLLKKERQSNDEIQEALKELIEGLRDLSGEGSMIRVKKMGELDEKPFVKVCQKRFSGENVELECTMLCSKWKENVRDSAWYPFKRVWTGEKMKEVVDEEDERLEKLREEWGEDVKNAVKTALEELKEFNPSGRYPVPVLWNFEERRKATLKEGIAHMMQQVRDLKRKRT